MAKVISDYLGVAHDPQYLKVVATFGDASEELLFSDTVVKINRKDKPQERILVVTNRALYNLNKQRKMKRRIGLGALSGVTASLLSDEFVLHVPSEYDYRISSPRKAELVECIASARQRLLGAPLPIHDSGDLNLKTVTVTRVQTAGRKAPEPPTAGGGGASPPAGGHSASTGTGGGGGGGVFSFGGLGRSLTGSAARAGGAGASPSGGGGGAAGLTAVVEEGEGDDSDGNDGHHHGIRREASAASSTLGGGGPPSPVAHAGGAAGVGGGPHAFGALALRSAAAPTTRSVGSISGVQHHAQPVGAAISGASSARAHASNVAAAAATAAYYPGHGAVHEASLRASSALADGAAAGVGDNGDDDEAELQAAAAVYAASMASSHNNSLTRQQQQSSSSSLHHQLYVSDHTGSAGALADRATQPQPAPPRQASYGSPQSPPVSASFSSTAAARGHVRSDLSGSHAPPHVAGGHRAGDAASVPTVDVTAGGGSYGALPEQPLSPTAAAAAATTASRAAPALPPVTGWSRDETPVGLESFELLRVIGRGSYGKVLQVRKRDTGEVFAMKVLSKALVIKRNQVEHTQAERAILESIDHPFLIKLRYAFQTPAKLYLVLPFLRGGEVFYHLKQKQRLDLPLARFYIAEIVLGVGHLHAVGIVYRDIKPENVLLDEEGHVKLTDFGLSKVLSRASDTTRTFCGTPEYLAPEVVDGHAHDKGVDWWGIGILLWEFLTGMPPFYNPNLQTMYDMIRTATVTFPPHFSPEACDLLVGLLERDPTRRLGNRPGDGDVEAVKAHAFFAGIDWEELYQRRVAPPWKPPVKAVTDAASDTANFDREFTSEPVLDSVASHSGLLSSSVPRFDGFTYQAPSVMQQHGVY